MKIDPADFTAGTILNLWAEPKRGYHLVPDIYWLRISCNPHEKIFAMEKEQLMNRSTVTRILDAMEFWTEEGNLLNFKVTQCGSENKKLFCLERPKG